MTENNTPGTIITATERRALHDHSHRMVDMLRAQCEKAAACFTFPAEQNEYLSMLASHSQQTLSQMIGAMHTAPQMHSTLAGQDFTAPIEALYSFNNVIEGRKTSDAAEADIMRVSKVLKPVLQKLESSNFLLKECALQPYIESLHQTEPFRVKKSIHTDVYMPMSNDEFKKAFDTYATQMRTHISEARNIIKGATQTHDASPMQAFTRIYEGVLSTLEETLDKTYKIAMQRPVEPSQQLPPR